MQTLNEFLAESGETYSKKQNHPYSSPNDSQKHDVYHGGKCIGAVYQHPHDEGWEAMHKHSNQEWIDNFGDNHHIKGSKPQPTKKAAIAHLKELKGISESTKPTDKSKKDKRMTYAELLAQREAQGHKDMGLKPPSTEVVLKYADDMHDKADKLFGKRFNKKQ